MVQLTANVNELWDDQAYLRLTQKGLDPHSLKSIFSCIYFPWDPVYSTYRFFFKLQIQELPLFVVSPCSNDEIIKILNLARDHHLTLRIISGRHSSNIQNPDVYVDMSHYSKIRLTGSRLTLGGGVLQGRAYEYLKTQNHYTFPGGTAGSVGISGFTTCGGIASLKRTFGLTIDSVSEYTIIVPSTNPRLLKTHPGDDLFWALSGGLGSNFGIITEIKYKLPIVRKVIRYLVNWRWDQAEAVLREWTLTAPRRPNRFNEDLTLYAGSGSGATGTARSEANGGGSGATGGVICLKYGRIICRENESNLGIGLSGIYVGENLREVKRELQSLVNLGGTLETEIIEYDQLVQQISAERVYEPFSSSRVFFQLHFNESTIPQILASVRREKDQPGIHLFGLEILGGQISCKRPNESAFIARDAQFFVDIFAYCRSSVDYEEINNWTRELFDLLYRPQRDYVFLGFPIPQLPRHLEAYYGQNRFRLLKIKQQYDPDGIMDFPQGIPSSLR